VRKDRAYTRPNGIISPLSAPKNGSQARGGTGWAALGILRGIPLRDDEGVRTGSPTLRVRLWPAVVFGFAGLLVSIAFFLPVLSQIHNPAPFLLFLGLPTMMGAAAGALLGPPLMSPSRPRSNSWAARRGAAIVTVALVLFAPVFVAAIKMTEPGWNGVLGLTLLVLWFSFIAAWWLLAVVGAVAGLLLYRWAVWENERLER